MKTLERISTKHDPSEEEPDINPAQNEVVSEESVRVPYLLGGVALAEGHAFSPNASNPNGPTTFSGMKIDDGTGSSD